MQTVFGRGETPEIGIELSDGQRSFTPGEVVRARITFSAAKGFKSRPVRAGLVLLRRSQEVDVVRDSDNDRRRTHTWVTHEQWVQADDLEVDTSGGPQVFDREWKVPAGAAPTYAGEITSNRWMVKVTIDRKLAKDVNAEEAIVVVSPLPAEANQGALVQSAAHSDANLRLELARGAFAEGEQVSGTLVFEPAEGLKARGLRVELARSERVTSRDGTNEKTVVVEVQELAREDQLRQRAEYPFAFVLARAGQPSHVTAGAGATASWSVRAILDRPMRGDVEAVQEVLVYTQAASV
ncbi:MAG: hypothetical protein KJ053_03315 [Dehalococcoidia bacterium]|nr:hypothetical protein [Dehalococcoidia bacterium]